MGGSDDEEPTLTVIVNTDGKLARALFDDYQRDWLADAPVRTMLREVVGDAAA